MRDIKFRAWHKEYKLMTQSFNLTDNCRLEGTHLDVHNYGDGWGWEQWNYWYLEDVELIQYTGLKDKNGTEIYEGDIMETHTGWKTTVRWDKKTLGYKGLMAIWEVIGNIHQNPELLEGGTE